MSKGKEKRTLRLNNWFEIIRSISHMIYPEVCLICTKELTTSEKSICSFCYEDLHFTHFEKYTESTSLDKLFWGRVSIEASYALLYFEKGQSTQQLLHALKYKSNPHVGIEFGRIIGRRIKKMNGFKKIDLLIPVPIHPKKEFIRGYNQSEQIANGVSEIMNIPVDPHFLKKRSHTGSQTKRGRFARWDNVVNNFMLKKNRSNPKHIAIIDDVITTGATLEALIRSIQKNYPDIRISIISLAITK